MPTLVSTGQFTIVDQNDARSVTAFLTASSATQQVFSKNNDTIAFTPSWVTTNLTLTPIISVGGLTTNQTWAALSNKQFSLTQGGAALTTASTSTSFVNNSNVDVSTPFTVTHGAVGTTTVSTFVIAANLKSTVASLSFFFDADFTDPNTGLVTHIACQITLNTVSTGTNATYVVTRGKTAIEEANGSTKNVIAIGADLVRSSGIDTSNLSYKWYEAGGSTQISTSLSGYATKYGLKTTTAGTSPTGSTSDLNVNIPASGSGNAFNTLVISENAIVDMGIYKVDITDTTEGATYSQYFTVYDITDPYDTKIISSSGDKLQNGQGSTNLTPDVYNGATRVTDLTGWTFTWYFYDKNGKRGAFVDTAKIATAGGAPITANTTGTSATITYSGTSYAFAAGDIVKAVKPNGDAFFYEVASSTTNVVTIRTPSTNTWLTFTDFAAPSASTDFVGGKLFGCTASGTRSSSAGASITLTGDDIDAKTKVLVEANRP